MTLSLDAQGKVKILIISLKIILCTFIGFWGMIGLIMYFYPFPNWLVTNGLFFMTLTGMLLGVAWSWKDFTKYIDIRWDKIYADEKKVEERNNNDEQHFKPTI